MIQVCIFFIDVGAPCDTDAYHNKIFKGGSAVIANVGIADRLIRAVLGVLLIGFVFVGPQTQWGWLAPWGWLGAIPLLTALTGFCPAYRLFGIRTCSSARRMSR